MIVGSSGGRAARGAGWVRSRRGRADDVRVATTVVPVTTTMHTWQAEGVTGLEGARVLLPGGRGLRALSRLVRPEFTASYRLVVHEDGTLQRLSLTSATADRERHLTINRTDDGFWLLDTGNGGTRKEFGGALDIDLEHSALFNTLPIRRLGLTTETTEHTVPMVFVSLPDLEVELVQQTYRGITPVGEDGTGTVGFSWDDFAADLTVDADGLVLSYPGIAHRLDPAGTPA